MRHIRIAGALVLLLFSLSLVPAQPRQSAPAPSSNRLEEMVPMRDGVRLATTIYLPEGEGPWPIVLVRTPYNKDLQGGQSATWVGDGFAFVIQDCRGRFKSEGEYRPFVDDHLDGHDTVEWLAKQKWSTGKIGMYGASAMGINANMAAMMNPPHLVAAFVMVARSSVYHQSAFPGGVFRKELNEIWLRRQRAEAVLEETFRHNVLDGFYDLAEMPLHWHKVSIPVYNYGGWYDIFSQGNIDNFVGLQSGSAGLGLGNQKLIMGPWAHGRMEEVSYPPNSEVDAVREAKRWFEYWLMGKDNGIMDEPPVRYYVMGALTGSNPPGNEWRTAAGWPVASRPTSFFLTKSGGLSLRLPEDRQSAGSYRYDPADLVPTIGGANLNIEKGPMDQRAIGDRKDILKFVSEPLAAPLEVTGRVMAELWAESDAPDTDWMIKLIDVYPDGTERLVLDGAVRARFREGFDREVWMKKGEIYRFEIDLWSTSIIFNRGHRIAVHVTSSNDPRFDPNPNTGKPLRADKETRVATNTVHHTRRHPSRIILPVIPDPGNGRKP